MDILKKNKFWAELELVQKRHVDGYDAKIMQILMLGFGFEEVTHLKAIFWTRKNWVWFRMHCNHHKHVTSIKNNNIDDDNDDEGDNNWWWWWWLQFLRYLIWSPDITLAFATYLKSCLLPVWAYVLKNPSNFASWKIACAVKLEYRD